MGKKGKAPKLVSTAEFFKDVSATDKETSKQSALQSSSGPGQQGTSNTAEVHAFVPPSERRKKSAKRKRAEPEGEIAPEEERPAPPAIPGTSHNVRVPPPATSVSRSSKNLKALTPPPIQRKCTIIHAVPEVSSQTPVLVKTASTGDNMEALRRAIAVQRCVLLAGPAGAGKTSLARFLGSEAGVDVVIVGLDSSVDVKDLIGTFRSTEPGKFEFQYGPLSTCLMQGKWLVLEDLDLASSDVSSALVSLVQTGQLYIPEEDKTLFCAPTFRLLATVQTAGSTGSGRKGNIPHIQLWGGVAILPPSLMEMFQCVATTCPTINEAALQAIKHVFECFFSLAKNTTGSDTATLDAFPDITQKQVQQLLPHMRLSLRELMRWGRRMAVRAHQCSTTAHVDAGTRDLIYLEALDSFCRHLPEAKGYSIMAKTIGSGLGMSCEKQDYILQHHMPSVSESTKRGIDGSVEHWFTVGRQSLKINDDNPTNGHRTDASFGDTKSSLSLLERLAVCVKMVEPVLLTGETGVGKTYMVQHLANSLNQNLVVHNLNQQSETSDIIGGYRPADVAASASRLADSALDLLRLTYPTAEATTVTGIISQITGLVDVRAWQKVLKLIRKVAEKTGNRLSEKLATTTAPAGGKAFKLVERWLRLTADAETLEAKAKLLKGDAAKGAFDFVEGSLVSCFRTGNWLLLDEVNLADSEILERISQSVEIVHMQKDDSVAASAQLTISERGGSDSTITMHPNFRLFACMNPPTDVGKKDLPPSLKSRFTEVYCEELTDKADLRIVVTRLLAGLVHNPPVDEVVDFYLVAREQSHINLTDNDPSTPQPHYSLRTLTRALRFTKQVVHVYGFEQALLEGIYLCFYSQLSRKFQVAMDDIVKKYLLHGRAPRKPHVPPAPSPQHVQFEHFWLEVGPLGAPTSDDTYVVTQSIADHLRNLARIVVAGRTVLLQGPTAAGKTSMVEYLARKTGHRCLRINNHETTDLQEYVGQYVSDDSGRLKFMEGALVVACREGHWIILDELNLAPSEVLEALNRLLDDNRELLIPETMEVIKPHPHFRLFATQNPPGIYGGRKQLSRAMRNRFMEILVDDIPHSELEIILSKRYDMPTSMAAAMIRVMLALQTRRQSSAVFQGKHGFITPRDLFRWAERGPFSWESLATHGMFLLGDRCRKPEEATVVMNVLQDVLKTAIPPEEQRYNPLNYPAIAPHWERFQEMMSNDSSTLPPSLGGGKLVATNEFKRLFVLVGLCLHHSEPFVLVGETGGGKTSVCQLWSFLLSQELVAVNCHQNSETSDFLGAFRPSPPQEREKGRLFTWVDGPIVQSMFDGHLFLLDEISLAEDAVLERLNSVFEPARTLTLPEKGESDLKPIKAHESFRVMATMNPAGDFGKKELSPALRNRMTEIYVTSLSKQPDLVVILRQRLEACVQELADKLVEFLKYFQDVKQRSISIRDVMAVCRFTSLSAKEHGPLSKPLSPGLAYVTAVDAILLVGLAIGTGMSESQAFSIRNDAYEFVARQVAGPDVPPTLQQFDALRFWDVCGMPAPTLQSGSSQSYSFVAATTQHNLSAILRVIWVLDGKAVLLEGSPGVGKTTLVQNLGAAFGTKVVRFNLSEQTDMNDLVGTYLPDPTAKGSPSFRWSDGLLLQALVNGWWVVLDELNLASQSVLEGLNALLDHRAELFVPELGKSFRPADGFRIFGCQNPLAQGGGRKGLPKSFLNRFTRVWVNPFVQTDLNSIIRTLFPKLSHDVLDKVVEFVISVDNAVSVDRTIGKCGGPWEFNLRDIHRWCSMIENGNDSYFCCFTLFVLRFRTADDRAGILSLYERIFQVAPSDNLTQLIVEDDQMLLGTLRLPYRRQAQVNSKRRRFVMLPDLPPTLASFVSSMSLHSLVLLCGSSGSGKSSLIEMAAEICNARVSVFPLSTGVDTVDLLGQFQQQDGSFVWHDSLLIKALVEGHWLVLDNANFASPTVLDRLNGLLEPGGDLVLNECGVGADGEIRIIKPHTNFRLILSMDTKHGEVSRAMRNRGVEIFLPPFDNASFHATSLVLAANSIGQLDTEHESSSHAIGHAIKHAIDEHVPYIHALAIWHVGHLQRCFAMKAGEWGRAHRSTAPSLHTLNRCANMVKLLSLRFSLPKALNEAVRQCYLRGMPVTRSAPEATELENMCARLSDEVWLPTGVALAAFVHPLHAGPQEQRVHALLKPVSIALVKSRNEQELIQFFAACAHYCCVTGPPRQDALQTVAAYIPQRQNEIGLFNDALAQIEHLVTAVRPLAADVHRSVDTSPVGISPLPPASTAAPGYELLPFSALLCTALESSAPTQSSVSWVERDKVLCAFRKLAFATSSLRHAKPSAKFERGAWRSAAGSAGALADIIPSSARDIDVLGWLHCYLMLAKAVRKLVPACPPLAESFSTFTSKVVQHFSLVGDLKSSFLWKRGGHPLPCPVEMYGALENAAEMRSAIVSKGLNRTESVSLWCYISTAWGIRSVHNVFNRDHDASGLGELCRVATARTGMLPADGIPLKLAAESNKVSIDLLHPLIDCIVSRMIFVDWHFVEESLTAVEDEPTVFLSCVAADRYSRHLLSSPAEDGLHTIEALSSASAEDLLSNSSTALRKTGESLSALLHLPRWDAGHSLAESLFGVAVGLLSATLQPFLEFNRCSMPLPLSQSIKTLALNTGLPAVRDVHRALSVVVSASETPIHHDKLFCSSLKEFCLPAIALLEQYDASQPRSIVRMGCSLALLGAWRLHLLQPTSPLDPAIRARFKADAAMSWLQERQTSLQRSTDLEQLLKGDSMADVTTGALTLLHDHCSDLDAEHRKTADKAVHRRSATVHDQYPTLFWEVQQFVSTLGSAGRLKALVQRMTEVTSAQSKEVAIREARIIAVTTEKFASSLDKFVGYEDATAPLRGSAAMLQLGLTLASRAVPFINDGKKKSRSKKRKAVDESEDAIAQDQTSSLFRSLLPQTLAVPLLQMSSGLAEKLGLLVQCVFSPQASQDGHWDAVNAVVNALRVFQFRSALAFSTATRCKKPEGRLGKMQRLALADSESVYGAWVVLWDVMEAEQQRQDAKAAEEVKWKEKTTEIEGDDEALERTLHELFPSYVDTFKIKNYRKSDFDGDCDSDSQEEPEGLDEEMFAQNVRKMQHLLSKGELLDVVLQYICMVNDSVKLRFTTASNNTPCLLPKQTAKRPRSKLQAERVLRAQSQLMATPDQLEDDQLPEIPAPDVVLATELLDAPSTEIVRKRLQPSSLRRQLGIHTATSARAILAALMHVPVHSQVPGHALLKSSVHIPVLMQSCLSLHAGSLAAVGSSISDDVTERVRTGFNIYKEPDICEAIHGLKAVAPLSDRIYELLQDFPEHPPLLNLRDIVAKVLSLNPRIEPLMRILQGTELVLKYCHEWETTAHKGVSIATHIKHIGSAILRWRRLELHCWPHLLHARRRDKEELACRHAFNLWGLVKQTMTSSTEAAESSGMYVAVINFITNTTFSEFDLRVRLLAAHGQRIALVLADKSPAEENPRMRILCNLFLNAAAYFGTFLQRFKVAIGADSKDLKGKLSEFIKIQRWEDANYYALTASTQKSHREIAKVLRLWDAVLAKPILPWLCEQENILNEKLVLPDEGGIVPPPLVNKQKNVAPKSRKTAKAAVKEDHDDVNDEASPMSSFNIAITDATTTLSHESALPVVGMLTRGSAAAAHLIDTVVSRVSELQPPATEKKSVKLRSLKTLLETLEKEGFESRANEAIRIWDEEAAMLHSSYSIDMSLSAEGANVWPSATGKRERLLWQTSDRDFYRCLQSYKRFNAASKTRSKDINEAQALRMKLVLNQLFHAVQMQRCCFVPAAFRHLAALNAILARQQDCNPFVAEMLYFESALVEVCEVVELSLKHALSLADAIPKDAGLEVAGGDEALAAVDQQTRSQLSALTTTCNEALTKLRQALRGSAAGNDLSFSGIVNALQRCAESIAVSSTTSFVHGICTTLAQHCANALSAVRSHSSEDTVSGSISKMLTSACDSSSSSMKGIAEPSEEQTFMEGSAVCNELADALSESTQVLADVSRLLQPGHSNMTSMLEEVPWDIVSEAQSIAEVRLRLLVQYHSTMTRLCLVLSRLFGTLLSKGFCGGDDDEDGEGEGDGDASGNFQEGTGMDEGEGHKDVSDEIENEDQIMSAKDLEKDENKEQKDDKGENEPEGVDVDTNFEGQLEDVQRKEEEEVDDDQESSMSKEEGEVDGDEQDETKGEQKQDECENLRDADGNDKKEKMDDDKFSDQSDAADEDENDSQADEEDGGWDNEKLDKRMKENENSPEGQNEAELAAKEGIDDDEMDGDDKESKASDDSDANADKSEENDADGEEPDTCEQNDEAAEADNETGDANPDDEQNEPDAGSDVDEVNPADPSGEEVDADADAEDADPQTNADLPDQQKGADQGLDDGKAGEDQTAIREDRQEQSKQGEEEQAPAEQMQDSATGETMTQAKQGAKSDTQQSSTQTEKKESVQQNKDVPEQREQRQKNQKQDSSVDPYKALGQLLEQMREKMMRAEEAGGAEDEKDTAMEATADEYEIAPESLDTKQFGAAPVNADEELKTIEEDFMKEEEIKPKDEPKEEPTADDDNLKKEETGEDRAEQKATSGKKSKKKQKVQAEDEIDESKPEEDANEEDEAIVSERGEQLYLEIEQEVTPLAHELAQQLRLLLEPTRMDRLKGDYKTGKRLNMKKVISYIASGYKRDKIWMRRTKPSAREYQIVVAIDDSYSMSFNSAGKSALSALAVITKALAMIEAGKVAVAKFGSDVEFIQTFDDALTIDGVARTLGKFTFKQKETNVGLLMEKALNVLDEAKLERGPSGRQTSDLLQLMFIMSDGKIQRQYREDIRRLVNKAQEQNQLVVFVILDDESAKKDIEPQSTEVEHATKLTPAAQMRQRKQERAEREKRQYESILQMIDVDFLPSGDLRMTPFMEGFPFPFYIVVNSLQQLPTALSDSLAQWFEATQHI